MNPLPIIFIFIFIVALYCIYCLFFEEIIKEGKYSIQKVFVNGNSISFSVCENGDTTIRNISDILSAINYRASCF